jgi:hypothetical protein
MPASLPSTIGQTSTGGLPNEVHADADTDSSSLVAKRLLAECFGTLLLVTVDCGGAVIGTLDGEITAVARSAATGLLVMTMIYSIGNVSGAHFNPAVTSAFALRGRLPVATCPHVSTARRRRLGDPSLVDGEVDENRSSPHAPDHRSREDDRRALPRHVRRSHEDVGEGAELFEVVARRERRHGSAVEDLIDELEPVARSVEDVDLCPRAEKRARGRQPSTPTAARR